MGQHRDARPRHRPRRRASGRRATGTGGHPQPSSGSRVNEPALAFVSSSIWTGRAVEAGRRPGRAVLDEAVAGVVVARDDRFAGVQAQAGAGRGAQPDRAGVRLDRPGHRQVREGHSERAGIQLHLDGPDRCDGAEVDRRRAGIHLEVDGRRATRQPGRPWPAPRSAGGPRRGAARSAGSAARCRGRRSRRTTSRSRSATGRRATTRSTRRPARHPWRPCPRRARRTPAPSRPSVPRSRAGSRRRPPT